MANRYLKYAYDVNSQCGEDGVLEAIFKDLEIEKGICCEFGAWDGKHLSNTYNLISSKNWSAILIEGNKEKFKDLQAMAEKFEDVTPVCAMVDVEGEYSLDNILSRLNVDLDFDLLSIDIDGCDYHIWKGLRVYKPKVVIIEFNPTIPNFVDFVQPFDFSVNQGCSLKSIAEMAKEKGYELAATTENNGIFVIRELFPKLGIENNSLNAMRDPLSGATVLYQLFDGTIKTHGMDFMRWHGFSMTEADLQTIPKFFRYFPDTAPKHALLYFKFRRFRQKVIVRICQLLRLS